MKASIHLAFIDKYTYTCAQRRRKGMYVWMKDEGSMYWIRCRGSNHRQLSSPSCSIHRIPRRRRMMMMIKRGEETDPRTLTSPSVFLGVRLHRLHCMRGVSFVVYRCRT